MVMDGESHQRRVLAIRIFLHVISSEDTLTKPRERALDALASALLIIQNGSSVAWSLQPVPDLSLAYDVAPLDSMTLLDNSLWALIAALRSQPQISDAEPVFA